MSLIRELYARENFGYQRKINLERASKSECAVIRRNTNYALFKLF